VVSRRHADIRAVVFDLWNTLAAWPEDDAGALLAAAGLTAADWPEHRERSWIGPVDEWLAGLGLDATRVSEAAAQWTTVTRQKLVPVDGALEVLDELRQRGLRLGLISNCSSPVADLWGDSRFAEFFDAVVLSADVGLCKPDPAIYRLAAERLGVEPGEALFVGDGDSGELPGAERVGMRAVGLRRPNRRLDWEGLRIRALLELLDLL
jgi:putative hydrolase of the HAD superfamily